MKLFDVYPLYDIEPIKGLGSKLWDEKGTEYLDLYGGHAVISIGHAHPHYIKRITDQLNQLGFYSNAVQNSLQQELANKLGQVSSCDEYQLFLCSTGAEANENALKLASFHTGRKKVIAMKDAFHGRTSGAVAATDNPKIVAPFNADHKVVFVPMNDIDAIKAELDDQTAAVIIEGMQGVAGIYVPGNEYLEQVAALCKEVGALLIMDEVQSGAGRSGKFFAFQHSGIQPDVISLAKGIGNGFPVAMVLIAPHIKPWHGMLGTTFGGNHLACAAALAVLEVIEKENLTENATQLGEWLINELKVIPQIKEVRGKGLMLGLAFDFPVADLRKNLLFKHQIFTGSAGDKNTIRLLPSLAVTKKELNQFLEALKIELVKC